MQKDCLVKHKAVVLPADPAPTRKRWSGSMEYYTVENILKRNDVTQLQEPINFAEQRLFYFVFP